MMPISDIIDPHACVFDVCMMPISMMRLKFCLGPTDEQADSRSWMCKSLGHWGAKPMTFFLLAVYGYSL